MMVRKFALVSAAFLLWSGRGGEAKYDCQSTDEWDPEKRGWCCATQGLGCPEEKGYKCRTTEDSEFSEWTAERRIWCCFVRNVGCPDDEETTPRASSLPEQSLVLAGGVPAAPQESEGAPTTSMAPLQESEGAPTTSMAPLQDAILQLFGVRRTKGTTYDCTSSEIWGEDKTAWCCETEGRGCPDDAENTTENDDAYDCTTSDDWELAKEIWCCNDQQLGCDRQAWTKDCTEGEEETWRTQKKDWCCYNQRIGCTADTATRGSSLPIALRVLLLLPWVLRSSWSLC